MNKSRRIAALQSRALAAAGWTVLQIDLAGCGDSEGDFADATWERWVENAAAAWIWLRDRVGASPWIWGLRAGCLVATEATRVLPDVSGLLFWQPVFNGKQHLQQLLRLKIAARMFAVDGEQRVDTRALHAQLTRGESVEVAGYTLSSSLALGLAAADLAPPAGGSTAVWLEVVGSARHDSPANMRAADWRAKGWTLDTHQIVGEPFWQTQEIAECPALIDCTQSILSRVT